MRMTRAAKSLISSTEMVDGAAKELRLLASTDSLQIVPAGDTRVPGIWASIITKDGDRVAPSFLEIGFDGTRSYVGATVKEADAVMGALYWAMHAMIHRRFRG